MENKRNRIIIGIAVAALLLTIPAWNIISAGGFKALRAKHHHHHHHHRTTTPKRVEVPPKIGPDDAPVKITVFASSKNECHVPSIEYFKKLADEYKGKVQVIFKDTSDPKAAAAAVNAQIGCEMGILINGRLAHRLEDGRFVMFTGPLGSHDWTEQDLRAVINHLLLKQQGKAKGASEKAGRKEASGENRGAKKS